MSHLFVIRRGAPDLFMEWRRALAVLLAAGLGSACASVGPGAPDQFRGTSGPVTWEIVDLSQRVAADQREIRWYYTVVLKETAGMAIQFEKVVSGAEGPRVRGAPQEAPLRRRLEPYSQLRWNYEYYIYFAAGGGPSFDGPLPGGREGVIQLHRFHGRDDAGKAVTFDVRFPLDPNVGKKLQTKIVSAQLPPADVPVWKTGYEWAYRWESPRGSGTFVWTVSREETADGIDCYVIRSGASVRHREIYYRKTDLAHYIERVAERIETRRVPPRLVLVWPISVGKEWEQSYTLENPGERSTENFTIVSRVESAETVTVPAGTFRAFRIVSRNKRTDSILYEIWYSPEVKQWILERSYFSYGVRARELTSFKLEPAL